MHNSVFLLNSEKNTAVLDFRICSIYSSWNYRVQLYYSKNVH